MEVKREARAGTEEKSDIVVTVSPGSEGIRLELESTVARSFGNAIRTTIENVVREAGVTDVNIRASDKGALDYVIKARTKTALARACR